jgi:hypothetical protein
MTLPDQVCKRDGFYLAVYSGDGMFHGVREWRYASLAEHWISTLSSFLKIQGDKFRASLGGPLSHVEIQFTSISGSALVTIYVNKNIAISGALASGNTDIDAQIIQMFHSSILKSKFLSTFIEGERFQGMATINERPLAIIVPWANPQVSDTDIEMTQEMFWHLAGAYFKAL